jgi:stage II sporulation protein D
MNRYAALFFLLIIIVVIFLPAAVVSIGRRDKAICHDAVESTEQEDKTDKLLVEESGNKVRVYRTDMDRVVLMDLEEYVAGVVLAEMPASFALEALKAQAVAARTYTLVRSLSEGGGGCQNAPAAVDVCTDSTHCQAWRDPRDFSEEALIPVLKAVTDTAGEVITYRGTLVEAVYHSTCGGKTEASHSIWSGGPVPYLQARDCSFCKHSPSFRHEKVISQEEMIEALDLEPAIPVAAGEAIPVELIETTEGGRVGKIQIIGVEFDGVDIRRRLQLPSTAFSWSFNDSGLVLEFRGHGHGVGLCQYGADGAARAGFNYREILEYYYPGTEIASYNN